MSISGIGGNSSVLPTPHATPKAAASTTKLAPDGDTPAVEAAENSKTQRAEAQNGGIAPKATGPTSSGGVNLLA